MKTNVEILHRLREKMSLSKRKNGLVEATEVNKLAGHFTLLALAKYTFPSIVTLMLCGTFAVFDALFVANFPAEFSGETSLAAINLTYPLLHLFVSVGYAIGIGGNALIAATMGRGHMRKAREIFSMLMIFAFVCGLIFAILIAVFIGPFLDATGASGALYDAGYSYCLIIAAFFPLALFQFTLTYMFICAGRPSMSVVANVICGSTNVLLDLVFVVGFGWGIKGAALATGIGFAISAIFGLVYFSVDNPSTLRFVKPVFDLRALVKSLTNGFSEFLGSASVSLITLIFNFQLMRYVGEEGVAAFGIVGYIAYIFLFILLGFVEGSEPIISFNYGANNTKELKSLFKKSILILLFANILLFAVTEVFSEPLVSAFVSYNPELLAYTTNAFRIYSFCYLFAGFTIFGGGFFTALNNGLVSAIIAFFHSIIFQVGFLLFFPAQFGIESIWSAVPCANFCTTILTVILLLVFRKKYKYF